MNRSQLYVMAAHVLVGIAIVVAATVLAALHDLDPQATVAIFGTAIGLVGASASAASSLGQAVNGKTVISQQTLADMNTTLSETVAHLAGARQQVDANATKTGTQAPPS